MKITDLRFNSRSLCGERKVKTMTIGNNIKFQFSLPVRGAYRKLYKERTCSNVSILAPCAGSVCKADNGNCQYQHVSILAPCAGSVSKNSSVYPITTPLFHLRTAYLRCESPRILCSLPLRTTLGCLSRHPNYKICAWVFHHHFLNFYLIINACQMATPGRC